MNERTPIAQPCWYGLDRPDVIFIALVIMMLALVPRFGIVGDPGVGWHLRIADQMWETGQFIHQEPFCFPTEGNPWVTKSWLADILFRLVYAWGGLNGLAVLTTLTMALALRLLYTRMLRDGLPGLVAAFWIAVALAGTAGFWVARPNIFTFVGLVLVAHICEHFHAGKIRFAKTLWLLPIFLLWVNLHGGYLAGFLVLGITLAVECLVWLFGSSLQKRTAARRRLWRLGCVCLLVFAVTLINPNGLGLHLWNYHLLSDSYVQTHTTTEWLPPDFSDPGTLVFEGLMLLLLALALLGRHRLGLLAVLLNLVWLHFALGGDRYTGLWVVIVIPGMALMSLRIPWLRGKVIYLTSKLSDEARQSLEESPQQAPCLVSLVFAAVLLFASHWMGGYTRHQPGGLIATEALDRLLEIQHGEPVFHDANWGGYLTWHGWDLEPRFKTFMDDRTDVHPRSLMENYFTILGAQPGWQDLLNEHKIELICVRTDSSLAEKATASGAWTELGRHGEAVIFRRAEPIP